MFMFISSERGVESYLFLKRDRREVTEWVCGQLGRCNPQGMQGPECKGKQSRTATLNQPRIHGARLRRGP